METPAQFKKDVLDLQRNEITEYYIYQKLSKVVKSSKDKVLLSEVASKEKGHYELWKKITQQELKPKYFKAHFYIFTARFLGLNFGLQLLERKNKHPEKLYRKFEKAGQAEILAIIAKEKSDEEKVLSLVDKDELLYTSAIILGLNDALVELTGALAGFTLALQNPSLVALAGFITGIAASFSMAASEYLSVKEEGTKNPVKASIYTGVTYLLTVLLLISPFFAFHQVILSLSITLSLAVFLIIIFNFYISIAKNLSFRKRVLEMILISLGVAVLNFGIGFLAKKFLAIGV